MSLTVGQLLDSISHRIGGPVDPSIGGGVRVVNLAGRHFYSMHSWRFALQVQASLDVVADQEYVDLPADFGELIEVVSTDGALFRPVRRVGPPEMAVFRNAPIWNGWVEYVSIEGTRLGIAPTPTSDEEDHLRLTYIAKWSDKSDPDDLVSCAEFAEGLLEEIVREYAAGREGGDLGMRLAAVESGPLCAAAKLADGMAQPVLGPLQGGAVGDRRDVGDWDEWMNNALVQY